MFLSGLNEEKKNLFLELCIHAALANHMIEEQEHAVMQEYATEMGLKEYPTKTSIPLDDLLETIKSKCSHKEIHIFVFEIAGLILSDHVYDSDEQKFVETLKRHLNVSNEKVEDAFGLVGRFMQLYTEANLFIAE